MEIINSLPNEDKIFIAFNPSPIRFSLFYPLLLNTPPLLHPYSPPILAVSSSLFLAICIPPLAV